MESGRGSTHRRSWGNEYPRRIRVAVALAAALLALATLAVARAPVAAGYEFSLFAAYPLWFWGALVGVAFVGQLLILHSAFGIGGRDGITRPAGGIHRQWRIGLLLTGAAVTVMIALPHVRYALYGRGDVLTHLGNVRHILATGTFLESNYYPVTHVLAALLAEFSALAPANALGALPVVFTAILLGSVPFFIRAVTPSRRAFLFGLSVAALPLFGIAHVLALPWGISFFLVPLVAYLFVRLHDASAFRTYALPFVLVVLTLVPFHPVTFLYGLGLVLALRVAVWVAARVGPLGLDVPGPIRSPTPLLGTVAFLVWYSGAPSAVVTGQKLIAPFLGTAEVGYLAHAASVASRYTPSLLDLVTLGVLSYGSLGLVVGAAGLFGAVYAVDRLRSRTPVPAGVAAVGTLFVGFAALTAAAFVIDFFVSFNRFARVVFLTAPALIGCGVATLHDRTGAGGARRALSAVLVVGLAALLVLSAASLHPSPATRDENMQVSEAELSGAEWYFEHRDPSLFTRGLGFKQFRLFGAVGDAYIDPAAENQIALARANSVWLVGTTPPDHFGYDDNETLAETAGRPEYLVVSTVGEERYPQLYPDYREFWRFRPDDFDRLARDPTVDRAYDNGELDVYVVAD